MATAIATIEGAACRPPLTPAEPLDPSKLRLFSRVPDYHHGVAALAGMVVVYETDTLHREGLQDGGFYVVESQRPRAGMSWSMFHEDKRTRLETSRRVVRVERCPYMPDHWQMRQPGGFWVDGPFNDINLCDTLVGKVVGLFHPAAVQCAGRA